MNRTLRIPLGLLAFLSVTLWALPAGADHPGRYTPAPKAPAAT